MYANIAPMKYLGSLNRRQKIALGSMALVNLITLALAAVVLRAGASAVASAPVIGPGEACGDIAARLLSHRAIAGLASVGDDNVLRVHLTGLDTHGKPLPQASDMAWDALAAVVTLPRLGCGPYQRIEIDVPAPEGVGESGPNTRLLVSANWLDLRAWSYGELDDSALAQRLETTLYTQPSK